jgi:RNA polymerase sigma factor (sigma-70 family)
MPSLSRNAAPRTPALDDARAAWPDARLVRECLDGSEEAWRALIFKYKNLIFSIPVKYGFSADDATDIFQAVCLDLLSELPKLRKVKALPKWIMQITAHKCFHRKQQQQRTEVMDPAAKEFEKSTPSRAEAVFREAEDEQSLRQAMAELPPRCRELSRWGRSASSGSAAWKSCANACWKQVSREAGNEEGRSIQEAVGRVGNFSDGIQPP